jgi:hypothetical protein
MIGLAFLFLALIFSAVFLAILVITIGVFVLGIGSSAVAAGSLAGSSHLKNPRARKSLVLGSLAVLLFGLTWLLVGMIFFFTPQLVLFLTAATLMSCGMLVVSLLGIRSALAFDHGLLRGLLVALFAFLFGVALLLTGAGIASLVLFINSGISLAHLT